VIEIHTAKTLVLEPNLFEVEIVNAEWRKYISPNSDKIPAEMIQAVGEALLSKIHKLINFVWNKEEVPCK
jgi:hypothetical protein